MKNVINIINQLRATTKTSEKLKILELNKDNILLQNVLEYTYNPFKRYGMSEKSIKESSVKAKFTIDIFHLLDILSESNINDSLRETTNSFLSSTSDIELKKIYKCMLLKDLKIGCNTKTINKIWKDLIPNFSVMLANKYFDKPDRVMGKKIIITTKLDGCRTVLVKDFNGFVRFYTRQGQLIDGLVDFENDLKLIPNGTVLDGESLLVNLNNLLSKDLYRETVKEFRKKGEKHNLIFNAFDIIPLEDFQKGICNTPCHLRKQQLHNLISDNPFTNIIEVEPLYIGDDISMIDRLLNKVTDNGGEGIMINLYDSPYECKRSTNLLKVKKFNDADVRVIDLIEGTGRNVGKLGSITIQFIYKDKLYTCDCGSGFSDEERELYWNNKSLLKDKIVTIKYFEISQESKTKLYGLRFPTWTGRIRDDKDEISMY